MSASRVLISGNMGYLGPVVAASIREAFPDAAITGFDTGFFAPYLPDPALLPERLLEKQWSGDVRRLSDEPLRGVDAVVHLAGISNEPMGNAFERATWEINNHAAVETALRAKRLGVRCFVFASSCSVYGSGDESPRNEESPLRPLTAYAQSKAAAEKGLREVADRDFAVTCLRFGTAFGSSPRLRLDLVLNDFVASSVVSRRIVVLGDGRSWRPVIHVKDVARAIVWALGREATTREPFLTLNAGADGSNYRILDLARAVQNALGDVEIDVNGRGTPDPRSYRVDFSRFAALAPECQPALDLETAIRDLSGDLTRAGFHDPEFRSSRWARLPVLEGLIASRRVTPDLFWR
jgi:nucleoside-diphosphate-sugar epimerase